jgi:hypothetical protein
MDADELARLFLTRLYEAHYRGEGGIDFHALADQLGVGRERVSRAYHELERQGLATSRILGPHAQITGEGMFRAEQTGLVDPEVVRHENQVRFGILDALQRLRDEHGPRALIDFQHVIEKSGITSQEFTRNRTFLDYQYLIEWVAARALTITELGTEQVRTWRGHQDRLERFQRLERLEGVTPQSRGHALEDLLAGLTAFEGWEARPRARSQGQEHDIIVHRGFHYFLVSCKWEQDRTQPEVLELLESRVRSRATTNGGILVSMAGFTDNCIEEARLKLAQAVILLFGPEDVEQLFTNQRSFTDLVDEKLQQAMRHRVILVDGVGR